jgi:hypothetical protein
VDSRDRPPAERTRGVTGPTKSRNGDIPVLFIAGAPRSGSTLLDRMIGMHEDFCSTGELRFIWQRCFEENQLCGCGAPFDACQFWREVSARAFSSAPGEVDAAAVARLKESVEHKRHLPRLVLNRQLSDQSALRDYGGLLERLYSAILDVSDARVLIDSSKDPRHGLVLARLPKVELHVVHLVRDPRAVSFSWGRAHRRPEIHWTAQHMTVQRVRATAVRWTTHNVVAELLGASAASYCRVRYEDFMSDPDGVLAGILAPYTGLDASRNVVKARQVVLDPSHTVAGNPMRFKSGEITLDLDDEWRTAMPLRDRLSVAAATWPLLARYGYSMSGRDQQAAASRTERD